MIPSEYIKTFLPIQELDEVKPGVINGVPPIGPDDLFLMSQLSTYATSDQNAVMVSKKINYNNFSHKLSDDFSISPIKLSVAGLSTSIRNLSSASKANIDGLCAAIQLSAYTLSTYTNAICSNLSSCIKDNYIANYGTQTCCFTKFEEDVNNPTWFATDVTLSNGKIYSIDHKSVSSLIVPEDWRIAFGAIAGDYFRTGTSSINNSSTQSITYAVLSDSYVNCCISAWEDDSYGPLEVYVKSKINSTGPTTILYQTLNNPGGFSGKGFYNYYHFAIPVKSFPAENESDRTQISVKYADDRNFKYDVSHPTTYSFSDYVFYAVPSKDDIAGCVKKDTYFNVPPANTKNVYNLMFNRDGLITDATSVYYGPATNSLCGLIKVNYGSFNPPNYPLKSWSDFGYVTIPSARTDVFGTIKLNGPQSNGNSGIGKYLWCGLNADDDGNGVTYVPESTTEKYGVVKLSGFTLRDYGNEPHYTTYKNISDSPGTLYGANVDTTGHIYVKIPYAQQQDGFSIPGVIKTGVPDTTKIRVVRSVYVDDDGVAKVNVVTPLGVGMFNNNPTGIGDDKGYDIIVELPLNSPAASYSGTLKDFRGGSIILDEYGSKVFQTTAEVNGFYMATLVYEGTADTKNIGDDAFLQIVCDDIIVTTIHPKQIATGKKFTYSTYLGLFPGGNVETASTINFAAISNTESFGDDKIYFLIREANNV